MFYQRIVLLIIVTATILYLQLFTILMSVQSARDKSLDSNKAASYSTLLNRKMYSCKNLRYRPPPLPDPVALVSFPGSGNTWLRHLLQESTGSVFLDDELNKYFPAENVTDGSVLVVKMHEAERFLRDRYKAAILMIRKPKPAILAEFNRLLKGHYKIVKTSIFKRMPELWQNHVKLMTEWWESLNLITLGSTQKPVHIVFYEELLKDTRKTLRGVLNFLNQTVSEENLNCALMNGEGPFRRVNILPLDPYTQEMHKNVDQAEERVMTTVRSYLDHNRSEVENT